MLGLLTLLSTSRPANDPVELDPGIITLVSTIVRTVRRWRQCPTARGAAGETGLCDESTAATIRSPAAETPLPKKVVRLVPRSRTRLPPPSSNDDNPASRA